MGAIIFTLLLLAAFVLPLFVLLWDEHEKVRRATITRMSQSNFEHETLVGTCAVSMIVSFVLGAVWLICAIIFYFSGEADTAHLRAQENNIPLLQQSLVQFRDYTITGRSTLNGALTDTAYQGAAQNYTEAVAAYRDEVRSYNNRIESLRQRHSYVILGDLIHTPHAKPITTLP